MAKTMKQIYDEAVAAGKAAGNADRPTPMVVRQHASVMDDDSPVTQQWYVADGPCGFAWVNVPGNSAMGRYMKSIGHRKGYPKGISYWVGDHGQSISRKEAHARAFAKVMRDNGIDAYADSRMD